MTFAEQEAIKWALDFTFVGAQFCAGVGQGAVGTAAGRILVTDTLLHHDQC